MINRKNTMAIMARLDNTEWVYYSDGRHIRPKGYVVTEDGFVCPIDDFEGSSHLSSITIDENNKLYCDTSTSVTNSVLHLGGRHTLAASVELYNTSIDNSLLAGDTENDDSCKISTYRSL